MKLKGVYEIHARIGRCHLHNKKKCPYSISLKMGTKTMATTEYKIPTDDQINFNTELILKIDRMLFQSVDKVSVMVIMQTEQKQKKMIGNINTNYKQKGLQAIAIGQCSCKDKSLEVTIEFEIVNIQNHNNNQQNNNKFQSPNNSQMKDLKKALTISRQKQLVKSSRTKLSTATKSPIQKTQSKINKHKIENRLKDQLSPDLSSLTTKISPHAPKSSQQSKQLIAELRNQIMELEGSVKQGLSKQKITRKEMSMLQSEADILKKENDCLLEILTFEEEKSSAAIQYISYLTQKISQNHLFDHQFHHYYELIQTVKKNNISSTSNQIRVYNHLKNQPKEEYSFYNIATIEEKQEPIDENIEKVIQQIEKYKVNVLELRQRIDQLENTDVYKNGTIAQLQKEIDVMQKQNDIMQKQNIIMQKQNIIMQKQNQILKQNFERTQKLNSDYEVKVSSLKVQNSAFEKRQNHLQKQLTQITINYDRCQLQIKQLSQMYQLAQKQNNQLQQKIYILQQTVKQLQQQQKNYAQFQREYQKHACRQKPSTPTESQIILKKTRFYDGEIENIINQMNIKNDMQEQQCGKELLFVSRKTDNDEKEHFMARNKSESLLNDLERSEQPRIQEEIETLNQQKDKSQKKNTKKINIPEHKKQVQKYNYDYDIDSLNYFNNFEENRQRMQTSGGDQNNNSEVDVDFHAKI